MKFQTKFWFLEDQKVMQPGKNLILGKKSKMSLKVGCFGVSKNVIPLMCYFWVYVMHHSCLYDSTNTTHFGKIIFSTINQNTPGQSDCKIF